MWDGKKRVRYIFEEEEEKEAQPGQAVVNL